MKRQNIAVLAVMLFASCFAFMACNIGIGLPTFGAEASASGTGTPSAETEAGESASASLERYKIAGEAVAAKQWTDNYDCSNFSVQFYQNCYERGLPCRVRVGKSGGPGFRVEDHAWNSVKIDGQWIDWEPQANDLWQGHTKTATPLDGAAGNFFTKEDVSRMLYEMIGRYVPASVIAAYEIDAYLLNNSPFHTYLPGACLSDASSYNGSALAALLAAEAPDNGKGVIVIYHDSAYHLMFAYKRGGKYYGVMNLEGNDPIEGRAVAGQKSFERIFNSALEIIDIDLSF